MSGSEATGTAVGALPDRGRTAPGHGPGRSGPPEPRVLRLARTAPGWMRRGGLAVLGGRVLLLSAGAIVVLASPFLNLTPGMTRALGLVSAGMLAVVGAVRLVPWDRLGPSAVVAFPVANLLAVGVLGLASGRGQIAFAGVLTLSFVYAGVFLPVRVGLLLVPLAWAAYCAMVPQVDAVVVVRLAINAAVWVAVMYALAAMTAYQRAVAEQLATATRTDALTELGNRRGLDRRLERLAAHDTVVVCDLDHFKDVNDRDGHAAGDEVLGRFAATVQGVLGPDDYAARYGGEEFVLVLHRAAADDATALLGALRDRWRASGAGVTFSAGIAHADGTHAPQQVLAAADVALYEAKAAGRDRFRTAPCPDALPSVPTQRSGD
ncbi:GGDEF domain-containing protein [Cellulomonas cellasea]|uniref:Diguanylate cyclase (GGDEF)-like protein n=1 Tax=Cellulomonas cellasea TaxID=43670 RepID=A0A7W4UI30_9CELL|nr:GGDEF domain-containing protein [Cellulomonas cellasea]MBB2924567.1 diguanylate cyclase (GGDEF)-like protein [Cellulomonas cellasea]